MFLPPLGGGEMLKAEGAAGVAVPTASSVGPLSRSATAPPKGGAIGIGTVSRLEGIHSVLAHMPSHGQPQQLRRTFCDSQRAAGPIQALQWMTSQ